MYIRRCENICEYVYYIYNNNNKKKNICIF